jgi:hypothetical protein
VSAVRILILLELLSGRMAVRGVAREAAGAHHQTLLVRDGQADLDAELVRLPGLAFSNALDFRSVQGAEFHLVVALLGAHALGAAH